MTQSPTRTMILVNPQAREGEVGRKWPDLERQVMGALGDGRAYVEFTTAVDYGAEKVREALRSGTERILVVGGDGTVSEAVQGFFEPAVAGKPLTPISSDATLMIMPAGRGDDFFKAVVGRRCTSSADAWKQGLQLLKHGRPERVDLGSVNWLPEGTAPRAFVNVASFGYPGLVVKRVHDHSGLWGRSRAGKSAWAYLLQSAAGLLEYKPIPMEVRVDDETVFEGPLFSGFILNGYYNAGGVRWSNEARIDDGLFNVVVAEPRDALATLMSGPSLLSGDWRNAKGVHLFKGTKVEVRAHDEGKRTFPLFDIDGDQPERPGTQGAIFKMLGGAIRLWK